MMLSRAWLKTEFNLTSPTVAWMLDIFGYSVGHTQLISEMGIDSMVFARVPSYLES